MALLVLIGAAGNTVTGRLIGADSSSVTAGMQGFCGALVGAATYATIGAPWEAYPIALAGGILCVPVIWLVNALFTKTPLRIYGLPSTTAPFCIVATIILFSTEPLHVSAASSDTIDSAPLAFVRSLRLLGSVVGSLCALALGEALTETANGLAGYSGVLTAIALAVVFLRSSAISWVLAIIGTAVTALVALLMHDIAAPTYTWPYILTTWVFLIIAHYIPAAKRP